MTSERTSSDKTQTIYAHATLDEKRAALRKRGMCARRLLG